MITDEQKEQNELARYYNTQIWAIPSIFFGLIGLMFQALNKYPSISFWNLIILVATAVFSFVLLLLFNKTHFQQLRLQSYIKKEEKYEVDENGEENMNKRSTWFSLGAEGVKKEAKRLREENEIAKKEAKNAGRKYDELTICWWQENLAEISTVKWVRRVMCFTIFFNIAAIVYILKILLCQVQN